MSSTQPVIATISSGPSLSLNNAKKPTIGIERELMRNRQKNRRIIIAIVVLVVLCIVIAAAVVAIVVTFLG